jgi:ATP-dependent DNA ligase
VLKVDGRDVRNLALIERKMRLKALVPKVQSRVRYVDHIAGSGREFFR